MKRLSLTLTAAAVGVLLLSPTADLLAQTPPKPATPSTTAPAAPATPAAKQKWVAPVKGMAEIGYTKPVTKVVGNEIVTTIRIQNLSIGSIALLRVDENWYDKGNNPIGGATYRHRKPLMPGEIIDITLKSPKNPAMNSNQYQFSHANGQIKPKVLAKIPPPAATS